MFLDYTDEQRELRAELRDYFTRLLTPEVREAIGGANEDRPAGREVIRQLGADGWLGLGWPTEWGGQGRGPVEQFILFDEVYRAGAPFPFVTVNTVGPTLLAHGTEEQKRRYLPGIVRGETLFAIGYSEPEAGTDLASLRTRAVRDGDGWKINGNKIFTSGAGQADHIWLACRTDPEAPKHRGITLFIVPTSDPGFTSTPIQTTGLVWTNATYYDDVRATDADIVGGLHNGWRVMTSQLGHERIGLAAMGGRTEQLYADVLAWARTAESGSLLSNGSTGLRLAECHARLAAMRLLNWRALAGNGGDPAPADSSMAKVFGTEVHDEVCHQLMSVVGPRAAVRAYGTDQQEQSPVDGRVEALTRGSYINTFGGGTNEVLRDMIATQGLGLPRAPRPGQVARSTTGKENR
ncbi:acyl-CoA dehydrogenase [Enemella dayhoffiae]|uniref:Acyl-CoA dehydrogenase n=1 Tax=Enemella dayhoffiae TaxID=2016507 RepID=A0A255GL51_9ACTN|nr:acyl-CoA dehydrogenase family protein [Enemella dayhoffiae]OYO16555.1 acyl-CoA dehydrogenase [Enemella dayhoffiae]